MSTARVPSDFAAFTGRELVLLRRALRMFGAFWENNRDPQVRGVAATAMALADVIDREGERRAEEDRR